MAVADAIALRGDCERAQLGAVIVNEQNRIIATGYNGPPAGTRDTCAESCPRLQQGAAVPYAACTTIHAEANGLLFCDRRDREGGTIYVTGAVCQDCAKLIANSGLARVVMRSSEHDAHRNPDEVQRYLTRHGIEVQIIHG